MFRSYDHLHGEIYTSQIIMTGVRFSSFRPTQLCFNCCSLFYSNPPLQFSLVRPSSRGQIYTSLNIMTCVRFKGFRLTQFCLISCSLFDSTSPLHVFVVIRSSVGIIYITNYHGWHEVQAFPSNATLLQKLFTISFKLSATCFGHTTIFMCKYIHHKISWLAWSSGVSV
jgi:hypothetical protein